MNNLYTQTIYDTHLGNNICMHVVTGQGHVFLCVLGQKNQEEADQRSELNFGMPHHQVNESESLVVRSDRARSTLFVQAWFVFGSFLLLFLVCWFACAVGCLLVATSKGSAGSLINYVVQGIQCP